VGTRRRTYERVGFDGVLGGRDPLSGSGLDRRHLHLDEFRRELDLEQPYVRMGKCCLLCGRNEIGTRRTPTSSKRKFRYGLHLNQCRRKLGKRQPTAGGVARAILGGSVLVGRRD
jgi:hypothetical protein